MNSLRQESMNTFLTTTTESIIQQDTVCQVFTSTMVKSDQKSIWQWPCDILLVGPTWI